MGVKCLAQEHNVVSRPGLEPGPFDPESSALTMRLPRLPQFEINLKVILANFSVFLSAKLLSIVITCLSRKKLLAFFFFENCIYEGKTPKGSFVNDTFIINENKNISCEKTIFSLKAKKVTKQFIILYLFVMLVLSVAASHLTTVK